MANNVQKVLEIALKVRGSTEATKAGESIYKIDGKKILTEAEEIMFGMSFTLLFLAG